MKRAAAAAYWILPCLFCLYWYYYGMKCWFQADDFAWLTHAVEYRQGMDGFWHSMFAPMAQGTIRPWSERAFFLVLYSVFGLNALPFRICAFLTQFASLALVAAIARRLTGARVAGSCAAMLWTVNMSLPSLMCWSSVYNQVLCGFFLLGAFHFFLRYLETGQRRDNLLQWIVFLLGFGALELMVVYPALAAAYGFLCARKHLRRTLPLFIPSILFAVVHRTVAPAATGVYAMHFDFSILPTLLLYWQWVLGPAWLATMMPLAPWAVVAATIALTAGLLGFVAWSAWRRRFLPLFCLSWFLILLAPVLPLRDHVTEYYVFLPAIGLAMLSAIALLEAWRHRWPWRAAAISLATAYLAVSLPATARSTRWLFERGRKVKILVRGVARAAELHPGKIILLKGVDDDLFWSGMLDKPFPLVNAYQVYLVPGGESAIRKHPEWGNPSDYVLSAEAALRALNQSQAVVYLVGGERLKNITTLYTSTVAEELRPEPSRRIDLGNPAYSYALGPTWSEVDGHLRWMPKSATVRVGGPRSPQDKLYVSGYCPHKEGAQIAITVDGMALPRKSLPAASAFELEYALPPALIGKPTVEVGIEVDRVIAQPGDPRVYGLVFGVVEIR